MEAVALDDTANGSLSVEADYTELFYVEPPREIEEKASVSYQKHGVNQLRFDDVLVFVALESLGTWAIIGNLCLIVVLLRNKYLQRASFVLMLSLAIADVVHGIVTTSFFYPPIVLRQVPMSRTFVRIYNIIDWTAWSITLTHMSAICLDRLVAIMLYGRYSQIVTVKRARAFTITCWVTFTTLNTAYILFKFCCLITPLRANHFYTFGYGEFEDEADVETSPIGSTNIFTFTYTPLEIPAIVILSISNPVTLVQLYRRHKRKLALKMRRPPMADRAALKTRKQWQRASTMLLEMSMRMGSKHVNGDMRELAARRANRQQQRILVQISAGAIIFYLYMTTYYLVYHVFDVENKWVVLFNSFFYSTTHMINPVIYFSLNKEMRAQLMQAVLDLADCLCCVKGKRYEDFTSSIRKKSSGGRTSTNKVDNSVTETSPLFSSGYPSNNCRGTPRVIARLQREAFTSSLTQLVQDVDAMPPDFPAIDETVDVEDSVVTVIENVVVPVPTQIQRKVGTITSPLASPTETDAHRSLPNGTVDADHPLVAMQKAQAQRNALLDKLIDALIEYVDEEDSASRTNGDVIHDSDTFASYLKPFDMHQPCQQSRSLDFSRSLVNGRLRQSATLHTFSNSSATPGTLESLRISPLPWSVSGGTAPRAPGTFNRILTSPSGDEDVSNNNPRNSISNWIQWAREKTQDLGNSSTTHTRTEALRESLKLLLNEASFAMIDDSVDEVISPESDASSADDVVFL
ncbi:GPCR protein [Aphelenchoides avenae]|nr:GPCR protein [Aphelenchus avenae]